MASQKTSYASTCCRERGESHLLKEHLKTYLPFFNGKTDILDLGCGRGEFLELLREAGKNAQGVEPDGALAKEARKSGAKVTQAYAGPFLAKSKPGSYDGLFLSHVIEHVTPDEATRWLQQAARVLRADGVLVVITPNVKCLGVMTHSFWRDPTHVRPYPKDLILQLAGQAGLHPLAVGEQCMPKRSLLSKFVNTLRRCLMGDYFGEPDLYVVVQKTKS